MNKKICVVTSTRAEYGLLRPLIKRINDDSELTLLLAVTGSHLSYKFGHTVDEIIKDNFPIDKSIEIPLETNSSLAMANSMSFALSAFSQYFFQKKPDMVVILGDRYEAFAIATAAALCKIPISHIHGGETTEGALDEFFRHSITKMSYLHFTSCETYRQRVIQLGENPKRVFNVGALGIENIKKLRLLDLEAVAKIINIDVTKPYCMITFHPVTLDENTAEEQFSQLLKAIDKYENIQFIFTKANSDTDGDKINKLIDDYAKRKENVRAFFSLGVINYLSAMKYSKMVIGNSSSGIIETPSFKIPTINIGDRQKGRIQATSVINCLPFAEDISSAIDTAFIADYSNSVNPYEGKDTSQDIINIIKNAFSNDRITLKKSFYDIIDNPIS